LAIIDAASLVSSSNSAVPDSRAVGSMKDSAPTRVRGCSSAARGALITGPRSERGRRSGVGMLRCERLLPIAKPVRRHLCRYARPLSYPKIMATNGQ
jgi:hypothetical protein